MGLMVVYAGIVSVGGSVSSNSEDLIGYLSRLLGRSVALDDMVQLSSGQQARVGGWLVERGFGVAELRVRLSVPFKVASLLTDGGASIPLAPTPPAPRPRIDGVPESLRIGIDIQHLDELLPDHLGKDLKSSSAIRSIFSLREISYAESRPSPLETLGGVFAAKEALRKCDSALLALPLNELEVLPDVSGRPQFTGFAVSISHSGGFAIAVAAMLPHYVSTASPTASSSPALPPPVQHKPMRDRLNVSRTGLLVILLAALVTSGLFLLKWL
jgi:phosphopantetheinyl transferase (holo-ACP synthase)